MRQSDPVLYQDIPQPKLQSKQFTNWSGRDFMMLATTITILVIVWLWLGMVFALFTVVGLLALNARTPKGYGRIYSEIATDARSAYRNSYHKGIWWRAEDNDGPRLARWLRRHHTAIPLRLSRIQATIDGQLERFSLLHQLDRPYDHLFIAADGGAFSSEDVNRQTNAVNELAELTNQIISQTDLKTGISYLRMTGPFDPTKVAAHLRVSMNPVIAQPELFDLDSDTREWAEWMRQNAEQLTPSAVQVGGSQVWSLIIITIKRTREWQAAGKGNLDDQEVYDLPIIEFGRALIDNLAASSTLDLQNVRCLSLPELASVVRCSWDVTHIDEYNRARASGEIPTTDEQIDAILAQFDQAAEAEAAAKAKAKDKARILARRKAEGAAAVDRLLQAWPTVRVETSHKENDLLFDDNYIGVLRVTKVPERIRSDQFLALHYKAKSGRWTRLAMVGQSVSGAAEAKQLVVGASALANWQSAFFSNRVIPNFKFAKKQRELLQQTQQISTNSIAQHFNIFVTVVESSSRRKRKALKEAKSALNTSGFQAEEVKGSARLIDYAISGMLGVNRA